MWSKCQLLGVLGATVGIGFYSYLNGFAVVDAALRSPPYPQKPYCVGSECPSSAWDDNWDLKKSRDRIPDTDRIRRHIILIRHGHYQLSGGSDEERTLTDLGVEQIQATADRLLGFGFPYEFIVSNTSTRSKKTMEIIYPKIKLDKHLVSQVLDEGFPVAPVPRPPNMDMDDLYYRDSMRMEYAFRSLFMRVTSSANRDSYEVIVCGGNLIRYFICRALQLPAEGWLRWEIPHGSITWLTIDKRGNVEATCIGDVSFIPADKVSY